MTWRISDLEEALNKLESSPEILFPYEQGKVLIDRMFVEHQKPPYWITHLHLGTLARNKNGLFSPGIAKRHLVKLLGKPANYNPSINRLYYPIKSDTLAEHIFSVGAVKINALAPDYRQKLSQDDRNLIMYPTIDYFRMENK